MKKTYCDRCKDEIGFNGRIIKCDGYALYLRGELPRQVAITELELCSHCKNELEVILEEFVISIPERFKP